MFCFIQVNHIICVFCIFSSQVSYFHQNSNMLSYLTTSSTIQKEKKKKNNNEKYLFLDSLTHCSYGLTQTWLLRCKIPLGLAIALILLHFSYPSSLTSAPIIALKSFLLKQPMFSFILNKTCRKYSTQFTSCSFGNPLFSWPLFCYTFLIFLLSSGQCNLGNFGGTFLLLFLYLTFKY